MFEYKVQVIFGQWQMRRKEQEKKNITQMIPFTFKHIITCNNPENKKKQQFSKMHRGNVD